VLVALPVVLGLGITVISPGFMDPLFEPGITRIMLIGMVVLEILGFIIMRKILDLKV